jgi:hypothetical protein
MSVLVCFAFLPPLPGEGWGGGTTASIQAQRSLGAAPIPAFPRKGKGQEGRP